MLLCVGASFYFLIEKKPDRSEAASVLLGGLRLVGFSHGFGFGRYPLRMQGRGSALFTLSLPSSLCDLVSIYADFRSVSRNQAYHRFIHQGLIVYLKAQTTMLETTKQDTTRGTDQPGVETPTTQQPESREAT
jgi:hypothetical protein